MSIRNTRRKFERKTGTRPLNKMFLIVPEGTTTEDSYFRILKTILEKESGKTLCIKCIASGLDRAPKRLLAKMNRAIKENLHRKDDEAWIVLDRDSWCAGHLAEIRKWSDTDSRFNCAISNPKFEYWLLLHFETPSGSLSPDACTNNLKEYIPRYIKEVPRSLLNYDSVKKACRNAKRKYILHNNMLDEIGSEVFRLVQNMMRELGLETDRD